MEEKTYRVTWIIEVDATSPRAAAEQALNIQRDSGSRAVVFEVKEFETEEEAVLVDLDDDLDVDAIKANLEQR